MVHLYSCTQTLARQRDVYRVRVCVYVRRAGACARACVVCCVVCVAQCVCVCMPVIIIASDDIVFCASLLAAAETT